MAGFSNFGGTDPQSNCIMIGVLAKLAIISTSYNTLSAHFLKLNWNSTYSNNTSTQWRSHIIIKKPQQISVGVIAELSNQYTHSKQKRGQNQTKRSIRKKQSKPSEAENYMQQLHFETEMAKKNIQKSCNNEIRSTSWTFYLSIDPTMHPKLGDNSQHAPSFCIITV